MNRGLCRREGPVSAGGGRVRDAGLESRFGESVSVKRQHRRGTEKRPGVWFVCVSVRHLPPAHWQLSSGSQAEFEEEIRGDISYPISKTCFCSVVEKAYHWFYLQALEGNTFRGLGAHHAAQKKHKNMKKGSPVSVFWSQHQVSHGPALSFWVGAREC